MWPPRAICRRSWKHEANQAAAPAFVAVRITDANAPFDTALSDEERVP